MDKPKHEIKSFHFLFSHHDRRGYLVRPLYLLRPVGVLEREVDQSDPDRSQLDFLREQVASCRLAGEKRRRKKKKMSPFSRGEERRKVRTGIKRKKNETNIKKNAFLNAKAKTTTKNAACSLALSCSNPPPPPAHLSRHEGNLHGQCWHRVPSLVRLFDGGDERLQPLRVAVPRGRHDERALHQTRQGSRLRFPTPLTRPALFTAAQKRYCGKKVSASVFIYCTR